MRKMAVVREMMAAIAKRQVVFLGHVMRRNETEAVVLPRMVEDKTTRGRPREKFMDDVTRVAGVHLKLADWLQLTRTRIRQRSAWLPKSWWIRHLGKER